VKRLNDENARFVAGCATTGAALAAGHWLPWWRPLGRLAAYVYGCTSILLGAGILLKFDRTWRRLCVLVTVAGGVVYGTYLYDAGAAIRARRHAGLTGDGADGA